MDSNKFIIMSHSIHKQFVKDTIALVPEGGNHKDLPKG
jgi:DNA (cytosine-5)-methyltransferase 1